MRKINQDDFNITETANGNKTVRWKHNNKACRTFYGYSATAKAKGYVNFLVNWYEANHYQFKVERLNKEGRNNGKLRFDKKSSDLDYSRCR